jgi:predicted ATPase/class 3 adenylate cyclase
VNYRLGSKATFHDIGQQFGDHFMKTISRPTGTVTFLITDIEQSTRRWEEQPAAMHDALAHHDATLKQAIERHGGWLFKHTGDGVLAAFSEARAAIDAAVEAQRGLELPVRMGICTGEAEQRNDDYYGPPLNRAARTMAVGHGGQVLIAEATFATVTGFELLDLGEHRLRDLARPQRLYQVLAEGLKQTFPPINSLNAALGSVPVQATKFLGREQEVKEVAALLRGSRLVTLTGVGGVGKTRLAVQVAAENREYPDGSWMIEFAAIRDIAAIPHALAAAVNAKPSQGQTIEQGLITSLVGRRLLLIFDNCEHLIEAVASLAHRIVTQCAQVTILVTSREALMIASERVFPVPPLGFAKGTPSPAVELFVDRARAVAAAVDPARDEAVIREICSSLDGIPLAIELAAARTRTMSPEQIRANLNTRFRLLTSGMRGALQRHQTLRDVVQWSFDLLSPSEGALLARASVFSGGFTGEAAEGVCSGGGVDASEILDLLDSLVRKSLMTVERSAAGMRFRLLETIRQFADERLHEMGEATTTRLQHANFFTEDSDANFRMWLSPRQLKAHEWLDREMDNLRSAFNWARDNAQTDLAARIASNVGDMARFRLRDEAANWAEEILDAARAMRHHRLTVLLTWAASSAWSVGHLEEGRRYGQEAIALIGDPGYDVFVWAFTDLAFIALMQGDANRAIELVRAGAEHEEDRRDRMCLATLLYMLTLAGRGDEARATADQTVTVAEAAGVPCATTLAWLAKAEALKESDPVESLNSYERAAGIARQSGNRLFLTIVIPKLAAMLMRHGDVKAALRGFQEMLEGSIGSRDVALVSQGLGNVIILFERLGLFSSAVTLNGALSRIVGSYAFVPELLETVSRLRRSLSISDFEAATKLGAVMSPLDANEFALRRDFTCFGGRKLTYRANPGGAPASDARR